MNDRRNRIVSAKTLIDPNSYEPIYAQLANLLRAQIADGLFHPDNRLPTEAQLCTKYSVSHMTVRRAINLLSDQGDVTAIKGKGTFVKPVNLSDISFRLERFKDLLFDADSDITLMEVGVKRADSLISAKIAAAVGDRVIFIRRLITRGAEPMVYHKEYLIYDPRQPIVESELELTSLHGLFTAEGNDNFKKGVLKIDPILLAEDESQLLKLSPQTAALRLEHLFYDLQNRAVSWGWFVFRGDLFELTASIGIWE
jgi:GntR family transcriptional regulator